MKKELTSKLIPESGKIAVMHAHIDKIGGAMSGGTQLITLEGELAGVPLSMGVSLENAMAIHEGLGKVLAGLEGLRN